MLQTWSRNSIWMHARHEPMTNPWYFSYDDNLMSWIYLHLACYLTLAGTWMNLNLWDCNSLTSWAISTSPSFYTMVVEDKEARNHSNISFDIMIVILDTQVLFLAKTNPCRKMNSNSKWCSQLLMSYINLEQPTQVQLHDHDQHHHPRYVIPS